MITEVEGTAEALVTRAELEVLLDLIAPMPSSGSTDGPSHLARERRATADRELARIRAAATKHRSEVWRP